MVKEAVVANNVGVSRVRSENEKCLVIHLHEYDCMLLETGSQTAGE